MIILRDQKLPLPAGAILISPWVDLTHSFPSVAGDGSLDYIPNCGFMQRPSASWPPPNADDIRNIAMHAVEQVVGENIPRKSSQAERKHITEEAINGFSVHPDPVDLRPEDNASNPAGKSGAGNRPGNTIPGPGHDLSILIDGKMIEIKDQIQMYTTNQLISHPLVSPILQPSLGGLPPLLILSGSGELLQDEQIYLAHKAANPSKYPPGEAYLDNEPGSRAAITRYKATDVQLQVWEDLCHVAPTLSFTRPAKYMFRSIAQFGAWALARAQNTAIDIQDDDDMSVISSKSGSSSTEEKAASASDSIGNIDLRQENKKDRGHIGKAGDPLPPFKDHMIRQQVDRHGNVSPLDLPSELRALQLPPNEIGVIKPGPVSKWMVAKQEWDTKYAREKRKVQKQRAKEMAAGYQTFGNDEVPPPSALAGRRHLNMPKEEKKGRSWGMSIWSLWGSSHDEQTVEREEKADREVETATTTGDHASTPAPSNTNAALSPGRDASRSRSRRRTITDLGQSDHQRHEDVDEFTPAAILESRRRLASPATNEASLQETNSLSAPVPTVSYPDKDETDPAITSSRLSNRPVAGPDRAFPFKLGSSLTDDGRNASTFTLESHMSVAAGVASEKR